MRQSCFFPSILAVEVGADAGPSTFFCSPLCMISAPLWLESQTPALWTPALSWCRHPGFCPLWMKRWVTKWDELSLIENAIDVTAYKYIGILGFTVSLLNLRRRVFLVQSRTHHYGNRGMPLQPQLWNNWGRTKDLPDKTSISVEDPWQHAMPVISWSNTEHSDLTETLPALTMS